MDLPDKIIDWLVHNEYIVEVSQNILGEPVYRFTKKFYKEQEELVKQIRITESDLISSLWFKNFIDVRITDDGQTLIYLTDKSDLWYSSDELSEEEKSMMYFIYTMGGAVDNRY
jgi:hypothetical protein